MLLGELAKIERVVELLYKERQVQEKVQLQVRITITGAFIQTLKHKSAKIAFTSA